MHRHEGVIPGLRIASVLDGDADDRLGEEDQLALLELVSHHLLESSVLITCQDTFGFD
ncbi:hypothetical protein D3C74_449220 [compost metagenome]